MPRKSKSQKIRVAAGGKSHYYDQYKGADRERLIHEFSQQGQLAWNSTTQGYTGTLIPLMNFMQFPLDLMWTDLETGTTNDFYVNSPVGWNRPGDVNWGPIFNKWSLCYVSSVSLHWTLCRCSAEDDSFTEFGMVPLNNTSAGKLTGTSPNKRFPPEESKSTDTEKANSAWTLFKRQPNVKFARIGNTTRPPLSRTIKMHIPVKKYAIPGYPLASSAFWTETFCNSQARADPGADFRCYVNMGIYLNSPSTAALYDYSLKVKYYVTHFEPNITLYQTCIGCRPYVGDATGINGGITGESGPDRPYVDPCSECPEAVALGGPTGVTELLRKHSIVFTESSPEKKIKPCNCPDKSKPCGCH